MKTLQFEDAPTDEIDESSQADDPTKIGSVILGRYTVEQTLGKGGMGVVVAARHHNLEELHAIKFLLPGMAATQLVAERFVREARAAARLKNEHVVRVHDVGTTADNHLYMVMEYLEGTTLKSMVTKGPLLIEDAVTCILQICEALAEAHASGIVHRDLKPANLHVQRRSDGRLHVKVLDFGIAKFVGSDVTNLTQNSDLLGTLPYMSPEHLLDSQTVDGRTDIWALGVVAYELLTATKPFRGYTAVDIVTAIVHQAPERPSRLRSELPEAIQEVILRCLCKNRDERYRDARELADALSQASRIPNSVAGADRNTHTTLPSADELTPTREDKTRPEFIIPTTPDVRKDDRFKLFVAAIAAVATALVVTIGLKIGTGSSGQTIASEGIDAPIPSAPNPATSTPERTPLGISSPPSPATSAIATHMPTTTPQRSPTSRLTPATSSSTRTSVGAASTLTAPVAAPSMISSAPQYKIN